MLRVELTHVEEPENFPAPLSSHPVPRPEGNPQRDEVLRHVAPISDVRIAEPPRNLLPIPFGSQAVARVQVVVLNVARRSVGFALASRAIDNPSIHRVLLASVEVVEPRSQEPAAAELAPIVVRNDVVGIVGARAGVAERTNQVAGEPRRRLHSHEAAAVRGLAQDLVDHLLIEGLHGAEIALHFEPGGEFEQRGAEVDDLLAGGIESDRLVDRRAKNTGCARALGLVLRLAFEEELAFVRNGHPESG